MRPHIHKKVSWDFNLKLFEKQHLKSHDITRIEELRVNLAWQAMYTEPCKQCEKILTKLEETQK